MLMMWGLVWGERGERGGKEIGGKREKNSTQLDRQKEVVGW